MDFTLQTKAELQKYASAQEYKTIAWINFSCYQYFLSFDFKGLFLVLFLILTL